MVLTLYKLWQTGQNNLKVVLIIHGVETLASLASAANRSKSLCLFIQESNLCKILSTDVKFSQKFLAKKKSY